jgi:peptide-methionine (S)-S-oxide reductase
MSEKAYLAGGCFWCLEAAYKLVPGVMGVVSGYAGGNETNPSYGRVSSGATGHVETVELEFDPKLVSYQNLLDLFFKIHDPSQKNGQGADIGPQYRSVIFYADDDQKNIAQEMIDKLKGSGQYETVYTELKPLERFWPAEEYHQNYFEKHPDQAYCQLVIRPKVEKVNNYLKEAGSGQTS